MITNTEPKNREKPGRRLMPHVCLMMVSVASIIFFLISSLSPAQNPPESVSTRGPVTVVYPVVMPPYSFEDEEGRAQGLAVDLLRLWSGKTGIPVQFKSAPWSEGLLMMRDGKADIHASPYYTEERDAYLEYASVVAPSYGSIFYHKNVVSINGPGELKAFRVGVVSASYHESYIKKNFPDVVLVSYPEFPQMLEAAQKGEIRVFVDDLGTTLHRLKESGFTGDFRYNAGRHLYLNNFWLAAREGDRQLVDSIKQGMTLITTEERAAIERKWLGASIVKSPDTLSIAIQSDFAPYTFINAEGQPAGLFVDIWRLWAKKTGKHVDFHATTWNETLVSMKSGTADIHSGLFYSDTRKEWLGFSQSYYVSGYDFFCSTHQDASHDLSDLTRKKVGVVKGSYQEEWLRNDYPKAIPISHETIESMLRAVLNGEISCCLAETLSAQSIINRLGLTGRFHIHAHEFPEKAFHAGVLKGNAELLALVTEGFKAITKTELAEIERHWVPDPEQRFYRSTEPGVSLTAEERAWLAAHPDIRIGLPEGLIPYVMRDFQGNQEGMLVDFLDELNRVMGTNIQLKTMPSSKIFEMYANRDIDVIYAIEPDKADQEGLLRTNIWAVGFPAIYARKGDLYTGLDDIAGKTIALRPNTIWDKEIVRPYLSSIKIVYAETPLDAMRLIINKEADLYLGLTSHMSAATKYRLDQISQAYVIPDTQAPFTMGVRPDWPLFASILNKGLAKIGKEGLRKIAANWMQSTTMEPIVELSDEEREWLKEHPDITLAYTDAFEPEVIVDPDGTYRGILVDILEELNTKLGTSIRLGVYPVPEVIEKAQTKKVDGILSIQPEYAAKLGLLGTNVYISSYPAVITFKDVRFKDPSEFVGKRIAIIDGVLFSEQIIEEYGAGATIVRVKNSLEGLQSVHKGDVDFFIGASLHDYLLTKYQLFGMSVRYVFYNNPIECCIAVRSDWLVLVDILNKGLSRFSKEEIESMAAKWTYAPVQKAIDFSPGEIAWLEQKHTVRVRVGEFPPYMFIEEDKITGMVIEYFNMITQRSGVRFQFVTETRPWQEAVESLMNLQGPDIITSISPLAEREPYMNFSEPYAVTPRVVFTRTDAGFISSIKDLNGRTLAVPRGTVVHKRIEAEYPDIELILYNLDIEAIEAVSSGIADAYIGNLLNTSYLIVNRGFTNLKVAAPCPFKDDVYTFAIRRDWPELRSIINKALHTMTPAEKAAIQNKYMSIKYEYGIRLRDVLKWVLVVCGIAAFIIFFFVTWNRSLQRMVKERTSILAESEERFRATFEQAAVGIAHVSPEGKFLRINREFCDIVGYTREEMLQQTFQGITFPEDLETDLRKTGQLLSGEFETYSMEKRYVRKDGELVWVVLTASLVRNEEGEPQWFASFIKDITERKRAEEKIRELREYTDNLIMTANVMIIGLDADGRLTVFNPAAERITGYSFAEIEGANWFETLVPCDRYPQVHQEFNRLLRGGVPRIFENPILTKTGEERFISWSNNEISHEGNIVGVISFGIDITERRKAEIALRESEEKFRNMMEQSPISIQIHTMDGKLLQSNAAYTRLYAFDNETLEELYQKYNVRTDKQAVKLGLSSYIERVFAGEVVSFPPYEYDGVDTLKTLDFAKPVSRKCWVQTRGFPLKDRSGTIQAAVFMSEDITEHTEAKEALEESEEKFRSLMQQSPFSIQIMSPEGKIAQVNSAFFKLWKLSKDALPEIIDKYNLLKDEQVSRLGVMPLIEKAFLGEDVVLPAIPYDPVETFVAINMNNPAGRKRWIKSRLYPIKDSNGSIMNIVMLEEDITDLRETEKAMAALRSELFHATRTGTMVELTGALAHELNHPLGSILNNANAARRFLEQEEPDLDEISEIIGDIISEDKRARDVMQKLRALMKKTEIEFRPLSINSVIEEVLKLTHSELVIKNVSLIRQFSDQLPRIIGDRVQLQQVFLNLIVNAIDAMKNASDRTLHISTTMKGSRNILVCFRDSGTGLDEGKTENIFRPFFTTKKEGMGMGLSVVRSIIKSHEGDIRAENNTDAPGASFLIYLPVFKEES